MAFARLAAAALIAVALSSTTTAAAQVPAPLSPERYAAIDATFAPRIKLDGKTSAARLRTARDACSALNPADPLLDRYRTFCLEEVDLYEAASARCDSRGQCRRSTRRLRAAVAAYLTTSRRLNRVIAADVTDRSCAQALDVGRQELRAYEQLESAVKLLQSALRNNSPRQAERALRRLDRISGDIETADKRTRFRRHCRAA